MNNLEGFQSEEKQVAEFDINVARISEIKALSKDLIIVDNKSYEATKAIRTEVVTMRTTLDKARKAKVKPLNDEVKRINEKAAELTALIEEVETPLQETVRAWEAKKEQEKREAEEAEQKRIGEIQARIASIRKFALPTYKTSVEMAVAMAELHDTFIEVDVYQELTGEALRAKSETLDALALMYVDRQQVEREDAERKAAAEKLAREQAEFAAQKEAQEKESARVAAIKEKIDYFKNLPVQALNVDSARLSSMITKLNAYDIEQDVFAELAADALQAKQDAVAALENLHNAALEREKFDAEKTELKRQQESLEAERKAEQQRKADEELVRQAEIAAKEKAARDAAEAEQKRLAEAEAARIAEEREEALRPDKEKLLDWIKGCINVAPKISTDEGREILRQIENELNRIIDIYGL